MDFSVLFTTENLIALLTLTSLEIVLGIDNVVFIAILCGKLPPEHREKARKVGLLLAMVMRILLLLALGWLVKLTAPLFRLPAAIGGWNHDFSGRDLILLVGGLFLVGKATLEIHHKLEGAEGVDSDGSGRARKASFGAVLTQILLLDIVFSLDSVITAVGMANDREVMIAAVVIAVGVMLIFSGKIASYIEHRPTLKILALSFLLLIGVTLIADGGGGHVPKGYVYFAMAFSLAVEMVNLKVRAKSEPLHLKDSHLPKE
ncbi:MAG: TerC family protein [Myxococcales bacterium]|nr:TerC family protein [Myxococcales bacterium]